MKFAPRVKFRTEKFGGILFDTGREKVFVANSVGKEILSLLEKGLSPEEIAFDLKDQYETDFEILRTDVFSYLEELQKNQLIIN